jgi:dihydroorotate dehydrogenase (NAD+) catalytic subunit
VAQARAVAAAVGVPLVGMGGICSGADAVELIEAGASLVAVGTESFRDPLAGGRVAMELAELLPSRVKLFP